MRRTFLLLALALPLVTGCFHANVDRDAVRFFSGPSIEEPPPDAGQRERNLYDRNRDLEAKVKDRERKIDRLEDEIKDLKKTIERQQDQIDDLRKALRR
jgi:predicted RNase H-like nuclease (RuvC/YqgF family)